MKNTGRDENYYIRDDIFIRINNELMAGRDESIGSLDGRASLENGRAGRDIARRDKRDLLSAADGSASSRDISLARSPMSPYNRATRLVIVPTIITVNDPPNPI